MDEANQGSRDLELHEQGGGRERDVGRELQAALEQYQERRTQHQQAAHGN